MVRSTALASMAAALCCSFAEAQFSYPSTTCPDGPTGQTTVSGATGAVSYPAGPGQYANDQTPCWFVQCAGTLKLTWTAFDTEGGYDHVTAWPVGSGGAVDTTANPWFRHSGSDVPPEAVLASGGDGALLQFKSDLSVTKNGFAVTYTCETAAPPTPPTSPTPPATAPPAECADVLVGNPERPWHDADGSTYTCAWYGAVATRCGQYGTSYPADGHTASTACCVCGGGVTATPTPAGATPTPAATPTPPTPPTPPAACNGKRVRKEWRQLSIAERALFIKAVRLLKTTNGGSPTQSAKGGYDKYPTMHGKPSSYLQAHITGMFFPWHRVFIQKFEDDLRSLGAEFECVTLPYWDWSIEAETGAAWDPALWNGATDPASGEFVGFGSVYNGRTKANKCEGPGAAVFPNGCCVSDGPFRQGEWLHSNEASGALNGGRGSWPFDNKCVFRFFANDNLPRNIAGQINGFLTQTGYGYDDSTPGFRTLVEGSEHSEVHARIGGYMITDYSPEDPIFFLHHANIDRLWAMWQVCHGYDNEASNVQYNAGAPVDGVMTGLNDEMSYHNFFDRAEGTTTDPQPAQWSGFTPAKVWDLHHADLYAHSGPSGPKVQYEINDFNSGSAYAAACPNTAATGQAGWFVAKETSITSLTGKK